MRFSSRLWIRNPPVLACWSQTGRQRPGENDRRRIGKRMRSLECKSALGSKRNFAMALNTERGVGELNALLGPKGRTTGYEVDDGARPAGRYTRSW